MFKSGVTVIVPIFNVEKYIEKCIYSIINQTYSDLEILLVDDGSTDKSGYICDSFKKKDSRIQVFHKENGGVSKARNLGIDQATRKYTMFVDGDDWIDLDCIEKCMEKVQEYEDAELILFPYIREFSTVSKYNDYFGKDEIKLSERAFEDEIYIRFFGLPDKLLARPDALDDLSAVWGKMYLTKNLKRNYFLDTKNVGSEDVYFNIKVLKNIHCAIYIPFIHYHYNKMNEESFTRSYNENWFFALKNCYSFIQDYINENNLPIQYSKALENRIVINLLALSRNIVRSDLKVNLKKKRMKEILNDPIFYCINNFSFEKLDLKWKLFYGCCKYKKIYCIFLLTILAECLKKRLR